MPNFRSCAIGAALFSAVFVASAAAEQIATMPVNPSRLTAWGNDGNDFTVLDKSTGNQWVFPSGDQTFFQIMKTLQGGGRGNVAQFAFVGSGDPDEPVAHAAWLVPLNTEGQPSLYPASVRRSALRFNAHSLNVRPAPENTTGFVLTDGGAPIATAPDEESLSLLKQLVQKYGVNVAWQTEQERAVTPINSSGPVVVFLRADGGHAELTEPAGVTASTSREQKPASGEPKCPWWQLYCK